MIFAASGEQNKRNENRYIFTVVQHSIAFRADKRDSQNKKDSIMQLMESLSYVNFIN